ncbi:MAG TPA: ribosome assembly RNA-binding protein YhbY [Longimicrobiales bacterium]|nr:ribosome assembly RNA-binding protein YhbY [Longimicrobiales bacterium]
MEKLSSRQRAHLKSLAHPLKPLLQIGKEGVSPAVAQTLDDAFRTRELLKVKVLESAPEDADDTGAALAAAVADSQLVQVIGRTIVLYRANPEEPEIRLPG